MPPGPLVQTDFHPSSVSEVGVLAVSEPGKDKEKDKSEKPEKSPNESVKVPWHFYWNGRTTTDGRAMSRQDYRKRVED